MKIIAMSALSSHRKILLTKFGINNKASLIKLAAKHNLV